MPASSHRSSVTLALACAWLFAGGCSSCSRDAQEKALREHAVGMCTSTPHASGAGCAAEVDRRFYACSGPYLGKETDAATFARCLGFVEPKVVDPAPEGALGRCDAPNITGRVSVALGKPAPWEGASLREIHGRSLYVASPVVSSADLRALRLEARGEDRFVVVELSSEAAKRLEQATAAHRGDFAVLGVNDWAIAARIGPPIPGPTLSIAVPSARLEDLCGPSRGP